MIYFNKSGDQSWETRLFGKSTSALSLGQLAAGGVTAEGRSRCWEGGWEAGIALLPDAGGCGGGGSLCLSLSVCGILVHYCSVSVISLSADSISHSRAELCLILPLDATAAAAH